MVPGAMEGVPTRAPTVVPKDGLGGRGIPRSGSPIRGRHRAPRARLAESPRVLCRLAAVVGVQYEGSPLAIPTPFVAGNHVPGNGNTSMPSRTLRWLQRWARPVQAQCHDGRCPLRPANQTAGWYTHRQSKVEEAATRGGFFFFCPPWPHVCPSNVFLDTSIDRRPAYRRHQTSSIYRTRCDLDATGPGAGKRMKDGGTR